MGKSMKNQMNITEIVSMSTRYNVMLATLRQAPLDSGILANMENLVLGMEERINSKLLD